MNGARKYWRLFDLIFIQLIIVPGQTFPVSGRQYPAYSTTLILLQRLHGGSTNHPVSTIHLLNSIFSLYLFVGFFLFSSC